MQDRFVGDIGDFAKYGLLRALSQGRRLGVAWYLMPDEAHTNSGNRLKYLERPDLWRGKDPALFDVISEVTSNCGRTVKAIERSGILGETIFSSERLETKKTKSEDVTEFRRGWFRRTVETLSGCDIVFADPDNGLCPDNRFKSSQRTNWKSIPWSEAAYLTADRVGIVYHHNSRFKGGHREEIAHWMKELPACSAAVHWRRESPRTFFVVNADTLTRARLQDFEANWHGSCSVVWSSRK